MERQVSFDVTDYNPEGDKWSTDVVNHNELMSGPSSPNQEMKYHEDATEEYVFITLDIHGDSVSVVSVKPVVDGGLSVHGNPEPFKSAVNPEKKSLANEPQRRMFEVSEALRGLNIFISMTDAGWIAVEKRFHKLRAKTNGFLLRSKFGECLGINSKEFAFELFDMLARRSRITGEAINLTALRKFWCQTIDQSLDSRLKMFFKMADKDGDGRLTEDEVREFIRLTASANNQPITKKMVNEYAALIMVELDPDDLGYIIMDNLELLLLDVETLCELTRIEETKKLSKRWCSVVGEISSSCLIPCLKKT